MLGSVDFGRFAYTYIAVTNAANAGAFYGATNPYTTSTLSAWQTGVKSAAAAEMGSISGFTSSNVQVSVVTDSNGDWRARCVVPCTFTTLINWPTLPHSITIQRSVDMRAIR
jgi:Flp pilus assembly protein TadG